MTYLKIFTESIKQAFSALATNKLRTILSLLGILIGIFSIIAVMSAVDSLEENIKSGFKELGSDVVYIDKMPWTEDPNQNYWKYAKRPDPTFKDYNAINERSKLAEFATFVIFNGGKTIFYENNSVSDAFIMGSTYEYIRLGSANIEKGRYFTQMEYDRGTNVMVLGAEVANSLFENKEAIGQYVKFMGQKFRVIGTLEAEGDNMFNFINFDEVIWITYNNAKRYINVSDPTKVGELLSIKALPGVEMDDIKGELTGILRAQRRLRPIQDNDFAVNELSMLENVIGPIFSMLNIVGGIIAFFALIVGMFSVANIMFVSVKERTNIIGIKKALGASKGIIVSEFLIESTILCTLGGLIGIGFVGLVMRVLNAYTPLSFSLSWGNIFIGVIASVIVGIISGIIPAIQASNLDPVEAIRQ